MEQKSIRRQEENEIEDSFSQQIIDIQENVKHQREKNRELEAMKRQEERRAHPNALFMPTRIINSSKDCKFTIRF